MKQAYKDYVATFLGRKNTLTGVTYRDDPTLMAIEVCAGAGDARGERGVAGAPRRGPPPPPSPTFHASTI